EITGLLADGAVGMAAAGGEIVGADDGAAVLDAAPAANVIGGRELGDVAVVVVGGEAGDGAHFAKRVLIEQEGDALVGGELAAASLADDAGVFGIGREAGVGDVFQALDLGEEGRPGLVGVRGRPLRLAASRRSTPQRVR